MQIKTQQLVLREIRATDLETIHNLHSLPETDRYNTLGLPSDIDTTKALLNEWMNAQQELPRKKYVFLIEKNDHSFVGNIGMNMGKPNYRNAEIWYKLHPESWGCGYATEALKGLLQFGFNELSLHRISAGCATENIASARVLEKAGFIKEGMHRKILPIRGSWVDNFDYAILEEDFFLKK